MALLYSATGENSVPFKPAKLKPMKNFSPIRKSPNCKAIFIVTTDNYLMLGLETRNDNFACEPQPLLLSEGTVETTTQRRSGIICSQQSSILFIVLVSILIKNLNPIDCRGDTRLMQLKNVRRI